MNVALISFAPCIDATTGNILYTIWNSQAHSNLDSVFTESTEQQCRAISDWPVGSPQDHNIPAGASVVLFMGKMEDNTYIEVERLTGAAITAEAISSRLQALQSQEAPTEAGQGGTIPTDNETGNGFGFGFGFNLPAWVWWLSAGLAGYKAAQVRSRWQQVAFGTLTGLAVNNALKAGGNAAVGQIEQKKSSQK